MSDDTISRQSAIDAMGRATWAINRINELPSAQPQRIRGKWTVKEGELAFWDVCSVCRKVIIHMVPHYNFCPNCGADMKGAERRTE